jgi:hypothetical protein
MAWTNLRVKHSNGENQFIFIIYCYGNSISKDANGRAHNILGKPYTHYKLPSVSPRLWDRLHVPIQFEGLDKLPQFAHTAAFLWWRWRATWQQSLAWYLNNCQLSRLLEVWPVQSVPSGSEFENTFLITVRGTYWSVNSSFSAIWREFENTSFHVVCLMTPSVANYHNNIVTAGSIAMTQFVEQPNHQPRPALRLFTQNKVNVFPHLDCPHDTSDTESWITFRHNPEPAYPVHTNRPLNT